MENTASELGARPGMHILQAVRFQMARTLATQGIGEARVQFKHLQGAAQKKKKNLPAYLQTSKIKIEACMGGLQRPGCRS